MKPILLKDGLGGVVVIDAEAVQKVQETGDVWGPGIHSRILFSSGQDAFSAATVEEVYKALGGK